MSHLGHPFYLFAVFLPHKIGDHNIQITNLNIQVHICMYNSLKRCPITPIRIKAFNYLFENATFNPSFNFRQEHKNAQIFFENHLNHSFWYPLDSSH